MTSEILAILDAEAVPKACVVGHSYGTLVASRLVKRFPARLHSLCLVDPVCFGMYMPHLLHNFFYRRLVIDASKWAGARGARAPVPPRRAAAAPPGLYLAHPAPAC
jgi:pimeloyl-ACP methyl ester carboxylesterase